MNTGKISVRMETLHSPSHTTGQLNTKIPSKRDYKTLVPDRIDLHYLSINILSLRVTFAIWAQTHQHDALKVCMLHIARFHPNNV